MATMTGSSRGLQRAAFAGIEFPVSRVSVKGGLREFVHEFPHVAGGAPEKLGRKLYEFTFEVPFHDVLPDYGTDLWPSRLADLRTYFELETTEDLVVPTIGTIQAYCYDWEQDWQAKVQSGESATFHFREDSSSAFLAGAIAVPTTAGIAVRGKALTTIVEVGGYSASLFDGIRDAVNSITALSDQADLYANLLEAKALGLADMCRQLDASLPDLQKPVNFPLIDALLELWAAAVDLHKDALRMAVTIVKYTVPTPMSVNDVARILYGSADRAIDVLRMNPIEDAFKIPANTELRVFVPTVKAA